MCGILDFNNHNHYPPFHWYLTSNKSQTLGPWREVSLADQININVINSLSKQIIDSHLFCDITSCYIMTKVLKRIISQSIPVTTSGFSQGDTNKSNFIAIKILPKIIKPDCCVNFTVVHCNNKVKCNSGKKNNFPKCMLVKHFTY